jgi:regulator of protease activity HflC (stomatin/prohibitin superfamily)
VEGFFGIAVVLVAFAIIVVWKGFTLVQQAETMVIERLGQYHRTLEPGINIIVPVLDRPRVIEWKYTQHDPDGEIVVTRRRLTKIDLRETVFDFPRQNVITKDNVVTEINALLYFQIVDPVKAVYEIANLPDAIEKLTQTTLRNIIGEMDLDETLSSRDTINARLKAVLDDATNKWGVKVNRVELQDVNPPEAIRDAMEKQMRAERDRRAAILSAEGDKQSKILEAEGQRQAEINKAEGEKQAQILIAEGQAQARLRTAEAESEAIRRISEALATTRSDPGSYLIAARYVEALKEMVSGKDNKVVYIPYEATGVLASLGGIKELFGAARRNGVAVTLPTPGATPAGPAVPRAPMAGPPRRPQV